MTARNTECREEEKSSSKQERRSRRKVKLRRGKRGGSDRVLSVVIFEQAWPMRGGKTFIIKSGKKRTKKSRNLDTGGREGRKTGRKGDQN